MFGGAGLQVHGLGGGATIVATVDVRKLSVEEWIPWGPPTLEVEWDKGRSPLLKFE